MKYVELEQLALQGNLWIEKRLYRNWTRLRYTWNEAGDIVKTKKVPYRVFMYTARTKEMPEGQSYRIRKYDFEKLNKIESIHSTINI